MLTTVIFFQYYSHLLRFRALLGKKAKEKKAKDKKAKEKETDKS